MAERLRRGIDTQPISPRVGVTHVDQLASSSITATDDTQILLAGDPARINPEITLSGEDWVVSVTSSVRGAVHFLVLGHRLIKTQPDAY